MKKYFPFFSFAFLLLGSVFLLFQQDYAFDFTSDGRYTLDQKTILLLDQLEEKAVVKMYLAGDLPIEYQKLQRNTQVLLERFAKKGKLSFEWIDPYALGQEQREKLLLTLEQMGLQVSSHSSENDGVQTTKMVVPAGILYYKDKKIPLQLLKASLVDQADGQLLQNAINQLEYTFAQGFAMALENKKIKIAFTQSNGELAAGFVKDFSRHLSLFYTVDFISLEEDLAVLEKLKTYDVLILAHPRQAFTEKQKYLLDQYFVRGGKLFFLLSTHQIDQELLRKGQMATVEKLNLNLDDLLYRYGLKIQYNLVADAIAAPLAIPQGNQGGQALYKTGTWYFHPVTSPESGHPISQGLSPVLLRYPSALALTREDADFRSFALLKSSQYSTLLKLPASIGYPMAQIPLEKMAKQYLPYAVMAYLLEGSFHSLYQNRPLPFQDNGFVEKTAGNRLLVISDGDFAKNAYQSQTGEYLPLGFDLFENKMKYSNLFFLLNAVEDFVASFVLYPLRAKQLQDFRLDGEKIKKEKKYAQTLHLVFPFVYVGICALLFFLYRRRALR